MIDSREVYMGLFALDTENSGKIVYIAGNTPEVDVSLSIQRLI